VLVLLVLMGIRLMF